MSKKEQLPIAWKEEPPVGHSEDKGTPEDEWDDTKRPRHPRKEIRRWTRGIRYVRICQIVGRDGQERGYSLHYGAGGGADMDCAAFSEQAPAVVMAKTLMRVGGRPAQ